MVVVRAQEHGQLPPVAAEVVGLEHHGPVALVVGVVVQQLVQLCVAGALLDLPGNFLVRQCLQVKVCRSGWECKDCGR